MELECWTFRNGEELWMSLSKGDSPFKKDQGRVNEGSQDTLWPNKDHKSSETIVKCLDCIWSIVLHRSWTFNILVPSTGLLCMMETIRICNCVKNRNFVNSLGLEKLEKWNQHLWKKYWRTWHFWIQSKINSISNYFYSLNC